MPIEPGSLPPTETNHPRYPIDKLDLFTKVSENIPNLRYAVPLAEGGEARLYRDGETVFKAFRTGAELVELAREGGEYVSDTFAPSHTLMTVTQAARLADTVYHRDDILVALNAAQRELEGMGMQDPRAYHPEVLRQSYVDWRHLQRNARRVSFEVAALCREKRLPVPPELQSGTPIIAASTFRGGIPTYTSLILSQLNGPLAQKYPQLRELELPKRLFPETRTFGLITENDWSPDILKYRGRFVLSMEYVPHTVGTVIKEAAGKVTKATSGGLLNLDASRLTQELDQMLPKDMMQKLYTMQRLLKAWGIVHGDLKWENIGIDRTGELVLLDASTLVAEGSIQDFATPEYFPPQLMPALKNGTLRAKPATDYYALQLMHRQVAGQMLSGLAKALEIKTPDRLAASAASVVQQTERRAQRR